MRSEAPKGLMTLSRSQGWSPNLNERSLTPETCSPPRHTTELHLLMKPTPINTTSFLAVSPGG